MFSIVVATDQNNGIGLFDDDKYTIPWSNYIDMKFFKDLTSSVINNNAVIMGRNTYFSLPVKKLSNRLNIVITSNKELITEQYVLCFSSLDDALDFCTDYDNIFVIGGSKLYEEALNHSKLDKIYWNIIHNSERECNIKFPITFQEAKNRFSLDKSYDLNILNSKEIKFNRFNVNIKINEVKTLLVHNNDETNYIQLLKTILYNGNQRQTRNAITKSIFGKQLVFDLKNKFPLLTTKKMFLRGIFEELIWFFKGQTDSKILEGKKVNIWKWNTTKEFIDSVNLPYREGDIGNMYGFQLKHAGAEYIDCDTDYSGKGFDQIEYCLNLLRNDKFSRRIIMTTFLPHEAHKGVLYPCHGITIQFFVNEINNTNYLSCKMYQRSADMFLGVPFNIASYSLIVYMFCHILNNTSEIKFVPDELIMTFGDTHIYDTHFDQVKEQINRIPRMFPKIQFKEKRDKLEDFLWEDIMISNYEFYPALKANMVA